MSNPILKNVSNRWLTISNILSLIRMLLTPCIVISMVHAAWHKALGLFFVAAITDLLDGYLARLFQEQTRLGAMLDPLADKVLLLSCFMTLAVGYAPIFGIPLWFITMLIVREVILVVGGTVVLWRLPGVRLTPSWGGKATTFFQILFIFWLLICYFLNWYPVKTYYSMLFLIATFSLVSFIQYVTMGWAYLTKK